VLTNNHNKLQRTDTGADLGARNGNWPLSVEQLAQDSNWPSVGLDVSGVISKHNGLQQRQTGAPGTTTKSAIAPIAHSPTVH